MPRVGWSDALARLLRPDRHPLIRLLESQPLTVADVLAAAPRPPAVDNPTAPDDPAAVPTPTPTSADAASDAASDAAPAAAPAALDDLGREPDPPRLAWPFRTRSRRDG